MSGAAERVLRIRGILELRFRPVHLVIRDDSAHHAGHAGATSEGGHFRVTIVAADFEGRSRLEQHRLVHEALGALFGTQIHALGIEARAPSEWRGEGS